MPRASCSSCHYPSVNCVCEHIHPVKHALELLVLQHPSEVKNAKNTVRLLTLVSNNTQVLVGESADDFAQLRSQIKNAPNDFALLFPSDNAEEIVAAGHNKVKTLILIDGTWKKAKKILLLNPWLQSIPHLTFSNDTKSQYAIRSSTIKGSLSTIEAAAYSMQQIENCDIEPFLCALNGLKLAFTKRMPTDVKARYQQRE